jgi:UDP-N-acetylmuramoylalanine--D-glutamate ligase
VTVVGVDRDADLDAPAGVVRGAADDPAILDGVGLVVKSPGVPGDAYPVRAARSLGIPVWSEIELGYRLLNARVLAVTGTNGKTTTSELVGAMLHAPVAGNVGRALTELDGEVAPGARVVCEVSSFQLEDVHRFRPDIAVLLNLEPDHLDRHGSLAAYRAAKLRVFENQREGDTAVIPRGFGEVPGCGRLVEFARDDPLPAEPLLPGEHNRENAAAAVAAARAAGASAEEIAHALRTFPGVPHRLEPVGEVGGVLFVNDSKATNVAAARRGVAAYADRPVRLIAGGSRKGEDFAPLAEALGPNVQAVYVIGETADELATAVPDAVRAGDLATATRLAARDARPGEVVLLSPACASFDEFANFEERGDAFRRIVRSLSA